jgi:microcystin-dependent protein
MTALKLVMTTAGLGRFTAAQASDDIDLTIARVALSATGFVAAPTLTALPGEFRRLATVSGSVEAQNIVHLTVTDDEAVTYQVRGFGLFLADGTLFAAYSQATPIAEKSLGSMLALAIDIAFPVAGVEQISFGNTDFLNPPATEGGKGVVELATVAEGLAGTDPVRVPPVLVAQAMMAARVPAGVILLWAGVAATVPAGWAICDGRTVDLADGSGRVTTPDLRDRVAVGASAARAVGTPFGATEVASTRAGDHRHTASGEVASSVTGATVSTTSRNVDAGGSANGVTTSVTLNDPGHAHAATVSVDNAGEHSHTVDVTQPSIALHYIMRL